MSLSNTKKIIERVSDIDLQTFLAGKSSETELVVNGDFTNWTGDNPDNWGVIGEIGGLVEVSEVGAGESYGGLGKGLCNMYASMPGILTIEQWIFNLVVGRKYRFSININKQTSGGIKVEDSIYTMWSPANYSSIGIKTFTFVATQTAIWLLISRFGPTLDITFDDVSIKLDDITQQVCNKSCWLFGINCSNPNSYGERIDLYNGFSDGDKLVSTISLPAYTTKPIIFDKPIFFSKGCCIKLSIGMFATVHYLAA